MGLLWTVFFSASKLDGHWINAAIMSRPASLGVNGGVGWPGLRASAWWLEGLSKDCISFWLTAIFYYKKSLKLKHSCQVRVLYSTLGFFFCKVAGKKSLVAGCGFWAYLKKYGCLFGKSDKQLCFFIYVRRILQCIDWHAVCSQLIANQCNNIRAIA